MPPPFQPTAESRPTVRSVPGPREAHAVEVERVELAAPALQPLDVPPPGGDRVVLVEADGLGDRLPEPLDVRLAEHLLRPALVRERGDRPAERACGLCLVQRVEHRLRPGAPDALLVEVGEELRVGVPRDHHERSAVARRRCQLDDPRGRVGQHLVCGMLDHRPPHVLVGVAHVDVTGACAVPGPGQRAHELDVLDLRVDEERLPRLEVDADANDQLGVPLEAIHASHNRESTIRCRAARRPTAARDRRPS